VLISLSVKYKPLEKKLSPLLKKALSLLCGKETLVEVYLVSNIFMRNLNRRFRKQNKTTNVLAFPFFDNFPTPFGKKYLGEIYLAPDYIKRRGENLAALLIHGLLHLLGYTHEKSRDRIKMEKIERRLVVRLAKDFNI